MPSDLSAPAAEQLKKSTIIGRGFTSDVYAWENGRVLKLFFPQRPLKKVEREFEVNRLVHGLGLPAPAAHQIIEVDGRIGIVFDRVDGPSMFHQVQARPWTLFQAARQLADLQARIHRSTAPGTLPSQREEIAVRIENSPTLTAAQKEATQRALSELPDGNAICHGDFHPANVLITARGPVVIDWSRATRGDPLGDVAVTCWLIRHAKLPDWAPWFMHLLLKCSRRFIYRTFVKRALALHDAEPTKLAKWESVLDAAALGWNPATGYE